MFWKAENDCSFIIYRFKKYSSSVKKKQKKQQTKKMQYRSGGFEKKNEKKQQTHKHNQPILPLWLIILLHTCFLDNNDLTLL